MISSMSEENGVKALAKSKEQPSAVSVLPGAVDDITTLPKGSIDPVYEAKARVLNHAVCTRLATVIAKQLPPCSSPFLFCI